MKKLFILLSILAITTPSYACGCGPSSEFLLTLFSSFIIIPLIGGIIAKKGKRLSTYIKCQIIWPAWFFGSAFAFMFIDRWWPSNPLAPIIEGDFATRIIIWLIIPIVLLWTYAYRTTRTINLDKFKSQIKENKNEEQ